MQNLRAWDPATVGGYELIGLLGAGGMGEVFLGRDRDGRLAAVKVVHDAFARDGEFRARFAREVATARKVRGPWTAAVIDADPDAPRPWLAAEYVNGPSLRDTVSEHGPLPEQTVGMLAARLAQALAAIHAAGLVHRDLTPANVLLAGDGPRVIDFGIARAMDTTKLTVTGQAIGTPAYMAPEQLAEGAVGPAADVFTLGSLLYFAATGNGPFDDTSVLATLRRVAAADPDLSPLPSGIRDLVRRCLAASPADRPTAEDLASTLVDGTATLASGSWLPPAVGTLVQEHRDRVGVHTLVERPPPAPVAARTDARSPRRWKLVLGVTAVVVLAGLGTVAAIFGWASTPDPSAAASTGLPASAPAPSAPPSPAPVQRVGFVPAVIPGWTAATSLSRDVAYDVPPSWEVRSPGEELFVDGRTVLKGTAWFKHGACPGDQYGERALAGVSGSSTSNPADVAKEMARSWGRGVYSAVDGRDARVRTGPAVPITVQGVAGVHVTSTVDVPVDGPCDPPRAVIHTIGLPGTTGGVVVWVLVADQGVDDAVAEPEIQQIIGSIRRAGVECPAPDQAGTWC
jgi:hypothetical protein